MKRSFSTRAGVLVLLAIVATSACTESTSPRSAPDPVGVYAATEFTTTSGGVTTDRLAEGVTLTLSLAADGTTTGSLIVPAAGSTLDLTGTWMRDGAVVTFRHPTQSLLDVLPFRVNGDRLEADGDVGPGVVHLILSR